MSENEESKLTDHEYDGIREYDNALPNWWLATFIGTVIFGSIYWLHYEIGGGPTLQMEFAEEMKQLKSSAQAGGHTHNSVASEDELLKKLNSSEVLAAGKLVFDSKCISCHGNDLQGTIGPNLVDEYWLHGKGRISEIQTVVNQGVPEKGMPTWGAILSDEESQSVAVFVKSRFGSKPANAKAPQGEKVVVN